MSAHALSCLCFPSINPFHGFLQQTLEPLPQYHLSSEATLSCPDTTLPLYFTPLHMAQEAISSTWIELLSPAPSWTTPLQLPMSLFS